MGRDLADRFVGMYVNHWTLDYGERGRESIRRFLQRAHAAGLIPNAPSSNSSPNPKCIERSAFGFRVRTQVPPPRRLSNLLSSRGRPPCRRGLGGAIPRLLLGPAPGQASAHGLPAIRQD
jgi:hypothetical protein